MGKAKEATKGRAWTAAVGGQFVGRGRMGSDHRDEFAQALAESRVALALIDGFDRESQGAAAADEDDHFSGARDGRVEQVALQHEEVLRVDGNDDARVFAALGFVDGAGVGECQFVEVGRLIGDRPPVEVDRERAFLLVDGADAAEVAVEDLQVVVVRLLHHLVARAQQAVAAQKGRARGD